MILWWSLLVASATLPWAVSQAEAGLRVSAMLLQFLGLAAVALGLRDTQRRFGITTLDEVLQATARRIWTSLTRPFRTRRPPIVLQAEAAAIAAAAGMSAHLSVWRKDSAEGTVDERIAALWHNLEELKRRLEFDAKRDREQFERLNSELDAERRRVAGTLKNIQETVRKQAVDGIRLEGFGLVALLMAVPFGLFSRELDAMAHFALGLILR